MKNAKDLKRRLNTITSINQVLLAVQKIAATYSARLKSRTSSVNSYSNDVGFLLEKICPDNESAVFLNSRLCNPGQGFDISVIFGSDKGMCGGFNGAVIAAYKKQNSGSKDSEKLILAGRKIINFFKKTDKNILFTSGIFSIKTYINEIESIQKYLMDLFNSGKISSLTIFYTHYKSASVFQARAVNLFPYKPSENELMQEDYLYEPDRNSVLELMLPLYLKSALHCAALNSLACENASRLVMMQRAGKNSKDMIGNPAVEKNKLRQSLITGELSEITGSAAAME